MKFEYPFFALLFIAPLFIFFLIVLYRRIYRTKIHAYFSIGNITKLKATDQSLFGTIRVTFWILAVLFSVVALMGPLLGERIREIKQQGVDIIIALDVSNSMNAQDVIPSRFEKSKLEIRNLIQNLKGDRIGLIVFENDAFLQCPLTTDYSALYLYLDALTTGYLPNPGTNLSAPLSVALDAFNRTLSIETEKSNKERSKVLVIISDGEDHEGGLDAAITKAQENNMMVFTVGVGTTAGAPVPVYGRNRQMQDFKRDRQGNVITTKLTEENLAKVARDLNGDYYRISNNYSDFFKFIEEVNKLQKSESASSEVVDLDNKFQIPLLIALLLFLIELFLVPGFRKRQVTT